MLSVSKVRVLVLTVNRVVRVGHLEISASSVARIEEIAAGNGVG